MLDGIKAWWTGLINSITSTINSIVDYFTSYLFLQHLGICYWTLLGLIIIVIGIKLSVIFEDKEFKKNFFDPQIGNMVSSFLVIITGVIVVIFSIPFALHMKGFCFGLGIILGGAILLNSSLTKIFD